MATDGEAEQVVVPGGDADDEDGDVERHDDKEAQEGTVRLRKRQHGTERADEQQRQAAEGK